MNGQPPITTSPNLASVVSSIAALLGRGGVITVEDVAALRRMDPRHPAPAFFKIEGLVLDAHLTGNADARADLETRWAAITAGLAHLGTLHQPRQRLGDVLAHVEYSEFRFARLMRADADRLADELPALARFLAAKGIPVDWTGAAQLILSAERVDEEPVRRHLARDYYGSLARKETLRVGA
jgi:CRISPR type I-E-associated protein CasB/Cse2